MELEHKYMQFKVDKLDEEEGIFEGYGSIFGNVDNGGDVVDQGAFEKTLEENKGRIKILALHDDSTLPIGVPIEIKEDEKGLYLKAKISDTALGKDVKVLLKDGVLNELSIGYDPVKVGYDEDGNRHLKEVDLWEVSVVTWAMNPEATISGYKSQQTPLNKLTRWVEQVQWEQKEGRKISGSRLQTLEDASKSLKSAAKTLDSIIKEARGKESTSPKSRLKSLKYKQKDTIQFIL